MPFIIFDEDFQVPRDTEAYKKGQVVPKSRASYEFFKNIGANVRIASQAEIESATGKAKEKKVAEPESKPEPNKGIDPTDPKENPAKGDKAKKKSGPSSQAVPASQEKTATDLNDLAFRPSESTVPTK